MSEESNKKNKSKKSGKASSSDNIIVAIIGYAISAS